MKAEQEQPQERKKPTWEEGMALSQRMFKLLGSKSRHYDQQEAWADMAYDAWETCGLSWETFTKVVIWSLTENEYTVGNLRLARNPGASLFVNQWENVELFYEVAVAQKIARLRKAGKPICPDCEMAPAITNNPGTRCDECLVKYHGSAEELKEMLTYLHTVRDMVVRTKVNENLESEWMVLSEPLPDPPPLYQDMQHLVVVRGWHHQEFNGKNPREANEAERMANMCETIIGNGLFDTIKALYDNKAKGFDVEDDD